MRSLFFIFCGLQVETPLRLRSPRKADTNDQLPLTAV